MRHFTRIKINGRVIKYGADVNRADLRNKDLRGANLTGAKLTAVKWSNRICPD